MDIQARRYSSFATYKIVRQEAREILARLEISDGKHFSEMLDREAQTVWTELVNRYGIRIFFKPLPDGLDALCTFFPETVETGKGYQIWINDNFLRIVDEDFKWAMVRSAGFHELAHILTRGPFRMRISTSNKEDDPEAAALQTALNGYARDEDVNRLLEARTELLAAEIAFAPEAKFLKLFYRTAANYRSIVKEFQMPLDCCAKWSLLLGAQEPCHYIKYNVAEKKVEDYFVPLTQPPYDLFEFPLTADLFSNRTDTVAARALAQKDDCSDFTPTSVGSNRFHCNAYYMKTDMAVGNKEKIIVVGFPEDAYNRLTLRAT